MTSTGDIADEEFVWQRDNVLNDWARAIEYAHGRLITSKTKVRIEFLREEVMSLAKHGGESCRSIWGIDLKDWMKRWI